jgi:hypothetical protein
LFFAHRIELPPSALACGEGVAPVPQEVSMARKNRYQVSGKRGKRRGGDAPPRPAAATAADRPPPKVYGQPFVVMEDENKGTFVYKSGAWVAHSMSIAECRASCQVTELPQKVKRMTRYEIRCPVGMEI